MTKRHRYATFGLSYLAQGAILAYFSALNAIYLLEYGVPMSRIGIITAIGMIPFVLKIFLGMLSDRVNLLGRGHRLPYIVIGLGIQAGGLAVLPFIDPGVHFAAYGTLAFIIMSGMALYDTCTDGLAIDTTPPEEEGTVQGLMVGGRSLGVVIISALIGLLSRHSWLAVFWALAIITLFPLPLVLRFREPPRQPGQSFQWSAFKSLGSMAVLAVGLYGALNSVVSYGANELVNPFLKETFSITPTLAGFYTAVWGTGAILGGVSSGQLADRIGHRRIALLSIAMGVIGVLLLAFINGPGIAWPVVFVFGIAFGCYETVFFALAMSVCQPGIEASMYAILMALANIGTGIGLALAGNLVDIPGLGYRGAFVVLAALNALVLVSIPLVFGKRPEYSTT